MSIEIKLSVFVLAALLGLPAICADVPKSSADVLIVQGEKQWAQGRLEEARSSFQRAIADNPRSVPARMKLAGLLVSQQDFGAAIPAYQQIISLDGSNALAWVGLGISYLHTGRRELAKAAFSEAVRIDPSRTSQLASLLEKKAQ